MKVFLFDLMIMLYLTFQVIFDNFEVDQINIDETHFMKISVKI